MNIIHGAGAKVIGTKTEHDFSFSVVETPTPSAGTTVTSVEKDVNVSTFTPAGSSNDFRIMVVPSWISTTYTFESMIPSIASVDEQGNVNRLINGTAKINIKTQVGIKAVERAMAFSSAPQRKITSYVTGSLGKHVADNVNSLIAGKSPTGATRPQNVFDGANRNPNAFLSSLDFSGVQWDGITGVVTLISPRHGVTCAHSHSHLEVGATVTFKSMDGAQTQTVTVVRSQKVEGTLDLYMGYFDQNVTVATPYKIMPANIEAYLPTAASTDAVPSLMRQTRFYLSDSTINYSVSGVKNIAYSQLVGGVIENNNLVTKGSDAETSSDVLFTWGNQLVNGDSGSPMFFPIKENNAGVTRLVLLGITYTGAFGADNLSKIATTLNSTMASLKDLGDSTTYTMSIIGLAGFNTYQ